MADLICEDVWIGDTCAAHDLRDRSPEERHEWSVVSGLTAEQAVALDGLPRTCHSHFLVQVDDLPEGDIYRYLDAAVEFMCQAQAEGKHVLVHSPGGVSRSAAVVAAYLMKRHGLDPIEAVTRIRAIRPRASPNSGFRAQLHWYHKHLHGKHSRDRPASLSPEKGVHLAPQGPDGRRGDDS